MQPGLGLSLQIVDMTKTIVRCEKKNCEETERWALKRVEFQ